MATLYLTERYSTVRRAGETLEVYIPANKSAGTAAKTTTVPMHHVERVVVQGDVTLTGAVVSYLLERRIPVAFCNFFGRYEGGEKQHIHRPLYAVSFSPMIATISGIKKNTRPAFAGSPR